MRLLGMDAYKAVVEKRDKREFDSRPIPEEILVKICLLYTSDAADE